MRRGTTPTHTFTLPFEPPEGTECRIVYAQGEDFKENILPELTTERCKFEGTKVSVKLKHEETLLFNCQPVYHLAGYKTLPVKIQIGVETPSRDILWSDIIETTVERCLKKDGVVCDG